MDVKTATRTLDLFEAFAALRQPASLSELADRLKMPVSSCHGLVRTIEARGYLYAVRPRGALYPTKRLFQMARVIAEHDPVGSRVGEALERLCAATGETVVIGKRSGARVLYLDVWESPHRIRYTAQPGEAREFHANSIGKALIGLMTARERGALMPQLDFARLTERTHVTPEALEADVAAALARGWHRNFGESVPDVASVCCGLRIDGEPFGISVVGPLHRMVSDEARHVAALRQAVTALADPAGD